MALKNAAPKGARNAQDAPFRYKPGAGVLYTIPAAAKLIALPLFTVLVMYLPRGALALAAPLTALAALALGFSPAEQVTSLKPALYYAASIYLINISANTVSFFLTKDAPVTLAAFFAPDPYYVLLCLRMIVVMQISALLFRTTTSIALKDTFCDAESALRRLARRLPFCGGLSEDAKIASALALALNFIPEIFEVWNSLDRAARARGCGNRFTRMKIMLPQLFSLSLRRGAQKALALAARGGR